MMMLYVPHCGNCSLAVAALQYPHVINLPQATIGKAVQLLQPKART
jgi:hypothetical protein